MDKGKKLLPGLVCLAIILSLMVPISSLASASPLAAHPDDGYVTGEEKAIAATASAPTGVATGAVTQTSGTLTDADSSTSIILAAPSPAIALNRYSGASGTSVAVTGSGFGAAETGITVTWDGTPVVAGISSTAEDGLVEPRAGGLKQGSSEHTETGASVTAKLDAGLLNLIDTHAVTYYKSTWNLTLEQYKAWIATIAWAEGGSGGYGAHSQGALGSDKFYHKTVGGAFCFSTGIGPFQLDRGGSVDNWGYWPTIDKLDREKAVKSVLAWHFQNGVAGDTLQAFANKSAWYAVNPDHGGNPSAHWAVVTGEDWNNHKDAKRALDWASARSQLASNASAPSFLYENNVKQIGVVQWDIKSTDNIKTDSGGPVVFDGGYQTWLITYRTWSGSELFKYYYTYRADTHVEAWVWDNATDPANKFRHVFFREYSGCGGWHCAWPEGVVGTSAGQTLSRPAISFDSATDYPGAKWAPAAASNYTPSNRPSSYPIQYVVIHVAQGTYAGSIS